MILVIYPDGLEAVADAIVAGFRAEYDEGSKIEKVAPDAVWQRVVEWDDLLIVVYNTATLPVPVEAYVRAYQAAHLVRDRDTKQEKPGGFIIPVCASVDPALRRPPAPISSIRSGLWNGTDAGAIEIIKAVGVFLGMALRPGDQHIFISYRASDGKELALDVHDRLEAAGFRPWLDAAKENLTVGEAVQDEIREHVREAAMLVLIDTEQATESDWVRIEVEAAIGMMIPVIPIVVGDRRNSRFPPLQPLGRFAVLKQPALTDESWGGVLAEVEGLLRECYRRRLKIFNAAEAAFKQGGFDWEPLDEAMRMYKAKREQDMIPSLLVLSHCSVHDIAYIPALRAYRDYIGTLPTTGFNHRLCIYDRESFIKPPEWKMIKHQFPELDFTLAHHSQLPMLIFKNFTNLK